MPSSEWYYVQDRQKVGPVSKDELRSLVEQGTISGADLVWTQGMSEWKPASQVQARFAAPPAAPASPAPASIPEENLEPAIDMAAPTPVAGALQTPEAEFDAAYDVGEGLGIDRNYAPTTEHEFASFGSRLGAFLIDSLILGIIAAIVLFGGVAVAGMAIASDPESSAMGSLALGIGLFTYALLFVIPWLYYARSESGMKMATIGKRALGIQVIDSSGYPISFLRATGRHFSKAFISGMICGMGYFFPLFTAKKQALHDLVVSTLVVKAKA